MVGILARRAVSDKFHDTSYPLFSNSLFNSSNRIVQKMMYRGLFLPSCSMRKPSEKYRCLLSRKMELFGTVHRLRKQDTVNAESPIRSDETGKVKLSIAPLPMVSRPNCENVVAIR